ncbi:MAG: tRNA (adenosine(37)-N6)-threonylcarbamoyltransferase complex dimerization subunit type 1 TsaB [Anderseniella sp.]
MIVLSVDTAHAACSACVFDTVANRSLSLASEPMQRGHAERLADMAQEAVVSAGISFADIERLAACSGPGTFTGVRIGLAFVRGLSLVLKVPVVGITTFAALAQSCRAGPDGRDIWVIQDARRGEVYLQGFDGDGNPMHPASVLGISEAGDLLRDKSGLAVGSGAGLVDLPDGLVVSDVSSIPDAAMIARLAGQAADTSAAAVPFYLRAPDAKAQLPLVKHQGSTLSIEHVGAEYAGVLAAIHTPCFEDAWDSAAMAALLATPGAVALLATQDKAGEKQPCGFVLLRAAADEMEVLTLAVLPHTRRRGVARALMQAVRRHAGQTGTRKIFIEYAEDNQAAHALYESVGYASDGVRPNYYKSSDGTASNAITASLCLSEAEPLPLSGNP